MKSNFNDAAKLFKSGKLNEAEHVCNEILKADPNNPRILHLLSVIAFQIKNYSKSFDLI